MWFLYIVCVVALSGCSGSSTKTTTVGPGRASTAQRLATEDFTKFKQLVEELCEEVRLGKVDWKAFDGALKFVSGQEDDTLAREFLDAAGTVNQDTGVKLRMIRKNQIDDVLPGSLVRFLAGSRLLEQASRASGADAAWLKKKAVLVFTHGDEAEDSRRTTEVRRLRALCEAGRQLPADQADQECRNQALEWAQAHIILRAHLSKKGQQTIMSADTAVGHVVSAVQQAWPVSRNLINALYEPYKTLMELMLADSSTEERKTRALELLSEVESRADELDAARDAAAPSAPPLGELDASGNKSPTRQQSSDLTV